MPGRRDIISSTAAFNPPRPRASSTFQMEPPSKAFYPAAGTIGMLLAHGPRLPRQLEVQDVSTGYCESCDFYLDLDDDL